MSTDDRLKADIDALMLRVVGYDDKPHQLYFQLRAMAERYLEDPSQREVAVSLMSQRYRNAAPCAFCGKSGHRPMDHAGWDPTQDPQ